MLQKRGSKKRSNLRFLSNISYKKESRSSYYVSKQYRAAFVPLPCRRSSCFLVDCLPHPGPGFGRTPRDGFDAVVIVVADIVVVCPKQPRR